MEELAQLETISSNSSSLELFCMGCESLARAGSVVGKLTGALRSQCNCCACG